MTYRDRAFSSLTVSIGLLLSICVARVPAWGWSTKRESPVASFPVLHVCTEAGFFPFEMQTKNGTWTGYDIDLLKKFAKSTKRQVTFQDMKFADLLDALSQSRTCDVVAAAVVINEERKKVVLFSRPIYESSFAALVRKNDKKKFAVADALNKQGVRIAVQQGTQALQYVRLNFSQADILTYDSNEAPIDAVLGDKADIFIDDSAFVALSAKRHPSRLGVLDTQKLPENDYLGMGIAFRREDVSLKKEFDIFFEKIQKNGELSQLKKYYFEDMTWMKDF